MTNQRMNLVALAVILCSPVAAQQQSRQQPLRIFIRSSEKTHGPGAHDYPAFLENWTKLLTDRGAAVDGAKRFPTAAELANTDVMINYSSDGANVNPEDRIIQEAYLKRGGGMVVIHDAMCGNDSLWYASVIGAAKQHGERNSSAGKKTLHFTDPANPILTGMPADLEMQDEMFFLLRASGLAASADGKPTMWTYGMQVDPGIHVLATTPDPQGNIVPQMWTYEKTLAGGQPYRAFVSLFGHATTSFEVPEFQTLLLRGIAWAGKRPVDSLLPSGR
jgi:Trehalose utilisation